MGSSGRWMSVVLLLLMVVLGACSPGADDAAWCDQYQKGAVLFLQTSSLDPETAEYQEAVRSAQDEAQVLREMTAPAPIEADWSVVLTGVVPGVEGQSPFDVEEASTNVSDWVIENCGFEPEIIDQLSGTDSSQD